MQPGLLCRPAMYSMVPLLPVAIQSNCPLVHHLLAVKIATSCSEMFLQDQCDGSTQTSHETLGLPNPRRLSYQNTGRDFRFDHWTEAMPLSRNITYDDDLFRRKTSDDHAHAAADRTRHSFKSTDGQRIADLGQRE